jgi:hypothetical protein
VSSDGRYRSLRRSARAAASVVEDKRISAPERVLDARRATIAARPGEIFEELGHAVIERRSIVATGLVAERRSQPAFADAGRPKSARL